MKQVLLKQLTLHITSKHVYTYSRRNALITSLHSGVYTSVRWRAVVSTK
jgi:hypothetical protein